MFQGPAQGHDESHTELVTELRPLEGPALGELVRGHRLAAGLTQEEVAERAGISARAVSDIERGLRRSIYRHTAERLAGALNLAGAELVAFAMAARGAPADDLGGERPGLPVPPTPLLGRAAELARLAALLSDPEVRIVTLTGPGGIGKTRVAIEAARRLAGGFPDGVCFISLAEVRESGLFLTSVAEALRVRDEGGPLPEAIGDRVGDRRLLLVLDTMEHLGAAVPGLGEIIARAPSLTLLATSRSLLRLRGEHELPIGPLDLAPGNPEAVELFLNRALALRPDFELDEASRGTVARICRRLDGVPLAIELAAARMRHLTAAQLLEQLERRLPVLTEGPVDLPPRQQTMSGTTAWSYELLASEDRTLFRRLSIFAGGWTPAAAEAVCGATSPAPLHRLFDASLVRRDRDGSEELRYRFLEVIRDFAVERLQAAEGAGGEGELGRRHAEHFLAIAEKAAPSLQAAEHRSWVARLDDERDNFRAALAWAIQEGDASLALRLAASLWMFWRTIAAFAEGRAWLEQVLALPASGLEGVRARVLWGAGWIAYQQGDHDAAESFGAELTAWARSAGEPEAIRNGLTLLGMGRMAAADTVAAKVFFEEALELIRDRAPGWLLATSLLNRAVASLHSGELDLAESLLGQALALYSGLGDDRFAARVNLQLGFAALLRGDPDLAERLLLEGLTLFADLGDRWGIAELLDGLAAVRAAQGSWRLAAQLQGASASVWESIGAAPHPADRASTERWLGIAAAGVDEVPWRQALAEGRAMDLEAALAAAFDS